MPKQRTYCAIFICLALLEVITSSSANEFDKVQITTTQITKHIYMLQGQGGNIGVCVGEDGIFVIDDQFAPLTEKIKTAIAKLSDQKIKFVINTHWHFDHVGGNENLGKVGSIIVAHENVRKRMSSSQAITFLKKDIPASPQGALPVITFTKEITFHFNGQPIHVFHIKQAHTDGDAAVYFKKENVLHTGDIFFTGMYPFIDTSSHGSIQGVINAIKHFLTITNNETKIISGHGPLGTRADLTRYLNMLTDVHTKMKKYIAQGKTLQAIEKLKPTAAYDAHWGNGFLSPKQFVQMLYENMVTAKK